MPGRSLRALGLEVQDGRCCPDGEPHEIHEEVLLNARETGQAMGKCQRCSQWVTVKRIGGGER